MDIGAATAVERVSRRRAEPNLFRKFNVFAEKDETTFTACYQKTVASGRQSIHVTPPPVYQRRATATRRRGRTQRRLRVACWRRAAGHQVLDASVVHRDCGVAVADAVVVLSRCSGAGAGAGAGAACLVLLLLVQAPTIFSREVGRSSIAVDRPGGRVSAPGTIFLRADRPFAPRPPGSYVDSLYHGALQVAGCRCRLAGAQCSSLQFAVWCRRPLRRCRCERVLAGARRRCRCCSRLIHAGLNAHLSYCITGPAEGGHWCEGDANNNSVACRGAHKRASAAAFTGTSVSPPVSLLLFPRNAPRWCSSTPTVCSRWQLQTDSKMINDLEIALVPDGVHDCRAAGVCGNGTPLGADMTTGRGHGSVDEIVRPQRRPSAVEDVWSWGIRAPDRGDEWRI